MFWISGNGGEREMFRSVNTGVCGSACEVREGDLYAETYTGDYFCIEQFETTK